MSTFVQQVAAQVIPAAATLASTGLLAIMALLGSWLQKHVKSEQAKDAIGRVEKAADAAVRDVSNTVLDSLKKNGALTTEARTTLKDAAESKLRATLGTVTVENVRNTLGFKTDAALIEFLQIQIESAVFKMKLQKQAVQTAAPVVSVATAA